MSTIRDLLALSLFSIALVVPFHPEVDEVRVDYVFEVSMSAPTSGRVRLYFDDGQGLRESLSSSSYFQATEGFVQHRLRVPVATLHAIRFDPLENAATIEITAARVTDADGAVIRTFKPGDFKPAFEIDAIETLGDRLRVVTTPGGIDPQLLLTLDPPLTLAPRQSAPLKVSLWRTAAVFSVIAILRFALARRPAASRMAERVRRWAGEHPGRAVALVALLAAVISCHPVVFLGRSFTSPNLSDGTVLLYERFPTLPGYTDTRVADANGSDVGAIAWHHHPLSIIEHRALVRDGELPLWNRYNSTGVTLLGQGQSMFGDPLHIIAVIANGAAWAWDVKYLLARWLFACGLGLIVLRLTRHQPAALITAFSSAFIGFFLFRVNHPAYFSLCYAPWMLYAWVRIADAVDARRALPWLGALILANFAELASGTAKEAYMLLLGLNFSGVIVLLARADAWHTTLRKLALAVVAGVLFVMLSAPIWVTFLDALARSYTSYNNPAAFQILPTLLPGLFDELFYRPIHQAERTLNPSANFLVLGGILYTLATLRRVKPDRMLIALGLGAAVPFAFAFGAVPPQWLVQIPFLGNVVHIDNTFSCVLIVHLIVLAGFGYRTAAERLGTPDGRGDLIVVAALMAVLLIPYIAFTHTVAREPFGPDTVYKVLSWGQRIPLNPFVQVSLVLLPAAVLIGLFLARRSLLGGRWTFATIVGLSTCAIVLLWRHGHQPSNAFKPYVFSPATRVDFHAVSPAIAYTKSQGDEPRRVVGFGANLFPGWSAVYDVETISGPDAVVNPHYREFAAACGIKRIWDWRLIVEAETLSPLRRAYDALNVRYFLDMHTEDPRITREMPRVFRGDLDVYRSDTTWPRAFFTDRVASYADAAAIGRLVLEGDGRPFAAIQTGDTHSAPAITDDLSDRRVKPATDYVLTNNTTSFTVEATGPGVIVLHEAWLNGDFRVTVNGQRARYFRVNHAFKGVAVDQAGTYRVRFAYWPRRFTGTLVAAGIAVAILAGIALLELRRVRQRKIPS